MRLKKKTVLLLAGVACIAFLMCAAGCSDATAQSEETEDPEVVEQYLPVVYTDDDGDLIQLTPNESIDDVAFMKQRKTMPYNTYYVDADSKGCKSCHADLRKLLDESGYEHPAIHGLDTEWTVSQCIDCHANGTNGYFTIEHVFATEMHGVHAEVAQCWNCHDTDTTPDSSNPTMALWDNVSHSKLRGIEDIADTDQSGTFTYSQDEITPQEDLYNLNEQYYEWDYLRMEKQESGEPLDEQLRDDWTITISGEVDKTMTFNLGELIKTAPMETKTMKWCCMINPVGGPGVGQVEATGIPLSYLTDQAGIKDTATAMLPQGIDGFMDPGSVNMELIQNHDVLLVTELNGEPLSWENGYPVMLMTGGTSVGCCVKQVSNIEFTTATTSVYEMEEWPYVAYEYTDYLYDAIGWPNRSYTDLYNTPNAGIIGLKEGQVVKTGEPLTINGYADAYDEQIVAVEISMDRGATWKRFETPDLDTQKLLTWSYEFTPEADRAYCFAVRSETAEGKVTTRMVEKLFVAHSNLDDLTVVTLDGEE